MPVLDDKTHLKLAKSVQCIFASFDTLEISALVLKNEIRFKIGVPMFSGKIPRCNHQSPSCPGAG